MLSYLDYKTIRILCRLSVVVSAICNSNEFNPTLRQKYQEYDENKRSQYY